MKFLKTVIFDFNRTLYDPDKGELENYATQMLDYVKSKGYQLILYGKGDEKRQNLISEVGIEKYFKEILLLDEKSLETFQKLVKRNNISVPQSYSIGDRIKNEIIISNQAGFKTIWFKKGKFATETPENKEEEPTYTITSLKEIKKII